ncbi:sulfatase-like hydrolase/transferase [Paenibacillus sp. OV219]|uniref:sulfatase-like hydrolase/transferase n=1 Tax=Paenibacillus sp. OV219 TaxID=1884377 RepID=UPI0008C94534|nr:sulfatase-like hydrolase/transferase [Paenibacillus sp. OV219]SEN27496.1 Arylsulfatase A [Paenibacillus sp. OV219]
MNKRSDRPNVIVFFTDQQRWDTTGVHANPLDLTPNFDRMARSGTDVHQSFTCQPVCGPARSAMQTGLYPTTTGCYHNGIPLPEGTQTLAHHFRASGYRTGYIGKWHLAGEEPVPANQRGGYEYWLASNGLEHASDSYRTVVYDEQNRPVRLPGYRVDALTDAAIRYIDQNQEDPFYLFVSYIEPHQQNHLDNYPAPDGYRERYRGAPLPPDLAALGGTAHRHYAGYCGMVKRLDEALGRLLDTLKSLSLQDNTIVLYTSDHGCHFRTRNQEYKRSPHDSSIRVPTAIQGPGFTGGGQIRQPVSLIDLPPTLLDAAGLAVPPEMQGRSILPLLHGGKMDWPEEVFVQISEDHVGRAIRTDRWKYAVTAPDKDGWKHAGSDIYVEEFLYDLHADPDELFNLAGIPVHHGDASRLREQLLRRIREAEGQSPVIIPAQEREWPRGY